MSDGRQSPVVPLPSKAFPRISILSETRSVYSSPVGVYHSPDSVPELMFTNPEELSSPSERTPVSPTAYLPQHSLHQPPLLGDLPHIADGDSVKAEDPMASGFRQSGTFEPSILPSPDGEPGEWPPGSQLPSLDIRRVSQTAQQLPPITTLSSTRPDFERKTPSIYISAAPSAWNHNALYSTAHASGSVSSIASHYTSNSSYDSWEASPIAGPVGHSYSDSALDIRGPGHTGDRIASSPGGPYSLHTSTSSSVASQSNFSDSLPLPDGSPSLGESGTAGSTPQPDLNRESIVPASGAAQSTARSPRSPRGSLSSRSGRKSSASNSPNDVLSIDSLSTDDSGAKAKRRGKLPREVTEYLKEWLMKHAEHPYPTEEEKKEMCRNTGLHMTQLSNWFINARRRILAPNRSLRGYQHSISQAGGPSQPSAVSTARPLPDQAYGHASTYSPSQYSAFESPYQDRSPYGTHLSHHPDTGGYNDPQSLGHGLSRSQSFAGVPTYGQPLYYPAPTVPTTNHAPYSALSGVGPALPGDSSPTTSPPGTGVGAPMQYAGPGSLPPQQALRIPHDLGLSGLYSPHTHGNPRYYDRDDVSDYNHPK